jgi:glycosyltransferase involved in cell wall biosynthesis/peptidoglycan/xylan/chitin deacetylase (PgdA/CDA1 family)
MTEITVVIPTFNRAEQLCRCLDALAAQTASSGTFEVVVVDDGSTDDTPERLRAYAAPFSLRVERQRNSGQPAALNRGIAAASSATCLFLDDDIVAGQTLVVEHVRAQRESSGVIALGALRLVLESSGGLAQYFAGWWQDHYRRLDDGTKQPDFWDCYSGNLSAPTHVLREVGCFDATLGRSFDVELAYRLVGAGLPIVYVPTAVGEQRYMKGFKGLVADFDRAGSAAAALYERHPELARYAPLGDFTQGGSRALVARRALLAARAPVWPLRLVDPLLPGRSVRLYRFLQLYCFWRSLRRALHDRDTWRRLTRAPTILMYHGIARPGERSSRYVLGSTALRRQLAWLHFRRRTLLSLDELVALRERDELAPAGAVVLTFDDGYADNAEIALPLLRAREAPATVFVITSGIGRGNHWDEGVLAGRPLLSWEQIRELVAAGVTIGAHSVTHPRLNELDENEAEHEIVASRTELERELGSPVAHFAYPYGRTSPALKATAERSGFRSAVGIKPGTNGPAVSLWDLRRYEVRGTASFVRFVVDLWLGAPLFRPRDRP